METQEFKKTTLHFNLRNPKQEGKASVIYAVVRRDERQYKLATGMKVMPRYWIARFEVCLRSPMLPHVHDENNRLANERISRIKEGFSKCNDYLCYTSSQMTLEEMRELIFKNGGIMSNTRKKQKGGRATLLLSESFESYYRLKKESTRDENYTRLQKFLTYVKIKELNDTVANICSQHTLDEFQTSLIEEKLSPSFINGACGLIVRLIKHDPQRLKQEELRYTRIKDKVPRDKTKKRALTNEEVSLLKAVKLEKDIEKEVRDVFICQLYVGQRISDMPKVFKAKNISVHDGYKFVEITTKKETTQAEVIILDEAEEIIQRYQKNGGFKALKLYDWKPSSINSAMNKYLKIVAKKAGLNNVEHWKITEGIEVVDKEAPFWDILTTHFARHTFITNMLKKGISPERLSYLTGHTDDKMIKEVYSHLTGNDKQRLIVDELQAAEKNNHPSTERKEVEVNEKGAGARNTESIKAILEELERFELVRKEDKNVQNGVTPSWMSDWERRVSYNGLNVLESDAYDARLERLYNEFRKSVRDFDSGYLKRVLNDVKEMREEFELNVGEHNFEGSIEGLENDLARGKKNVKEELRTLRFFQKMSEHQRYYFEKVEQHLKGLIE